MPSKPTYRIFSFYKGNVNPEVPHYQKAVFRYFGQEVEHVVNEDFGHGDFLNHICRTVTDTDILIFFDIDCIPLQKDWLARLLQQLETPHTVAGAAQTANHLRDAKNLYVSPFFFGVRTDYLEELGYPDMEMVDNDMDAGQNLTETALRRGGNACYWWPTAIEDPQWTLHHPEHTRFGYGTTYDDRIYHAFLSRFDLSNRFVRKCKNTLPFFPRLWAKLTRPKKA